MIPIERIGQTFSLPEDLQLMNGPDMDCYCARCRYKRMNGTIIENVSSTMKAMNKPRY